MKKLTRNIAYLSLAVLGLASCSADKDSAGLEYMPDMYRSAAIEAYVDYGQIAERENKELKMKQSAKTPPFGTIPFVGTDSSKVAIMLPYHRPANIAFKSTHGLVNVEFTTEDEYAKAIDDKNPLPLTQGNAEEIFKTGKYIFNSNCAHCHGEKGEADGPMMKSGAYSGAANLTTLTIGDGQMFYSIYYGKGMMGSHASLLNKEEIWTVIHYINKLQDSDYGTFKAEVTQSVDEADLAQDGHDGNEH